MKHLILLTVFAFSAFYSRAQVTSIDENFNSFCAVLGENYPTYWSEYDVYFNPLIAWTCGPTDGRGATSASTTPGIKCNNYDGSTYYTDTAWLFTPQLNLSFYSDNIYLQFDTKYLTDAARLSMLVSNSYIRGTSPDSLYAIDGWNDLTSATTPVLDNGGSASWTTHYVDLTPYKGAPLYVAFRYTSAPSSFSTWVLDNVLTTQTPTTGVPTVNKKPFSLSVIGNGTSRQVTLSYTSPQAAAYQLEIYDMMGRTIHKEIVNALSGTNTYTIEGLYLPPGMYLVKMGDGATYSTAKVIIP